MKKITLSAFLIWSIVACDTEIERTLSTDLQVEGTGIFNISQAYEESLYFLMLTLEDYRTIVRDSVQLPGCPELEINSETNEVKLTFSKKADCSSQKIERTGSLKINFIRNLGSESSRTMIYENYEMKNLNIQGERRISISRGGLPNSLQESFENIRITNPRGSSDRISGSFTHQLQLVNRQLIGFSTSGQLTGINIAGRSISMQSTSPRQYLTTCINLGYHLSRQGVERWLISRGETNSGVQHTLTFEFIEACQSRANMTLSDGRTLIFQ